MMQHTPGPWTISAAQDRTYPHAIESRDSSFDGFQLARCVNPADARLIAAAPALLMHLQRLVAAIDRAPPNFADGLADEARAAIAKATGA